MSSSSVNPLAPFLALHRHRDLFNQFARRAVELRHRASMLGLVWTVLSPLISLSIYTFIFGFVFTGRFDEPIPAGPSVSAPTFMFAAADDSIIDPASGLPVLAPGNRMLVSGLAVDGIAKDLTGTVVSSTRQKLTVSGLPAGSGPRAGASLTITKVADSTTLDYALGVFVGLILFNFLAEVLSQSPITIVTQPNFVKKVIFPLEILPAATVGAASFSAGISLVLALTGVATIGHGLDVHVLWLVAIMPPIAMIGFGCAWFFSALGVFIRDIANVMPFVVQVLIYMSAVFFSASKLREAPIWAQNVLFANPLLHAVVGARNAILFHESPDPKAMAFLWASGFAIYFLGYFTFRKLRPAFADVL